MKVSYNWLSEYFEEKIPEPQVIVDLLTMKSFEIEGFEKIEDDFMIDVDVLPNRSHDCLSHNGIAKEISAITGLKMKSHTPVEKDFDFESSFKIKVDDEKLCRRYIACEIKNLIVEDSPLELKNKLHTIGQKSINNIVDITNIVMFETGQPMHAFDTDKLEGQEISVSKSNDGELITTLDNKEVSLNPEILLIKDSSDPMAIAGVKGGKKAEVNKETTNIILESANFLPSMVRKTSRDIGITTESSKRFENEITPELAIVAMNRAIQLINQYVATDKTKFSNKIDFYPLKWRNYRTGVSVSEINSLLGIDLSEKEVSEVFDKLGFEYEIVNPREKIIQEAESLLDTPYKYGSSMFFDSPKQFDCSSFVSYVYSLSGYSIPRMTADQFVFSEKITAQDLLPGDLIFSNTGITDNKIHFETMEFLPGTKIESGVDHVGIYIGDGNVIHATALNNAGVVEEILEQSERFKNIVGYGRIIPEDKNKEKRFAVKVPIERLDIKNGPDLIEEVGRIVGYEKIVAEPATKKISRNDFTPKINYEYQLSNYLKTVLTKLGYSEIISYTFTREGSLEPLKPIAEDKSFIRESLLIGMGDALKKNLLNSDLLGLSHIKLFEIGKVFKKTDTIQESLMLSLGVKNKIGIKKPKTGEIIKEAIDYLGDKLGIDLTKETKIKILDDTEMLEINLYQLLARPDVIENLQKKINDFDQEEKIAKHYPILPKIDPETKYKTISSYPFMLRDIAVWVPIDIEPEKVLKLIKDNSQDILVNHELFDIYEKEGRISYAYHLVFQSSEKTLTDEEANLIMDKITQEMKGIGWEVR